MAETIDAEIEILRLRRARQKQQPPQDNFGRDIGRAALQGFSFGTADEAEAFVRSVVGEKSYSENLEKIRSEIKKLLAQFLRLF